MNDKFLTIDSFDNGEFSAFQNSKIPMSGASIAKNCYTDIDGSLHKRGKQNKVADIGTSTARIVEQCEFINSSYERYSVVVLSDFSIYYFKLTGDGDWTELTGFNEGFGVVSPKLLGYAGYLWIIDGKYVHIWDGETLTQIDSETDGTAIIPDGFANCTIIEQSQGVIWLSGYSDDPGTSYHSRFYDDDGQMITPDNAAAWSNIAEQFVSIEQDGETIVGLKNYKDILIQFTKKNTYALRGYIAETNASNLKISSVGCYDMRSAKIVNDLLYWVSKDGIYKYDGSSVQSISRAIEQYFSELSILDSSVNLCTWDSRYEFEKAQTLIGCNTTAIEGSIVPKSKPAPATSSSVPVKWKGSSSHKIEWTAEETIGGDYNSAKLQILYRTKSDNIVTVTLKHGLTVKWTGTFTPLSDGNEHLRVSTITVPVQKSIPYTLTIDQSPKDIDGITHYFELKLFNYSTESGFTSSYSFYTSGAYDTSYSLIYTPQLRLFPDKIIYISDVKALSKVTSSGPVYITMDDNYFDGEGEDYAVEYRYSLVSEADLLTLGWTVGADRDIVTMTLAGTGEAVWLQFRITLNTDSSASSTKETVLYPKIDKIQFIYYIGESLRLSFWGGAWKNRYALSIGEKGFSENRKVYVLNEKGGWTFFELYANAIWEQDNQFYYSKSDTNSIYRLSEEDSVVLEEWNAKTEFDTYAEDSDCDSVTVSGSLISDIVTVEDDTNSDNFDDSSIDDSWLNSSTWTESDGVLWKTDTLGGITNSIYKNIVRAGDFAVKVWINTDGIPTDNNATERVGIGLETDPTTYVNGAGFVNGYDLFAWRDVTDGFIKIKYYKYVNGVYNSTGQVDTGVDLSGAGVYLKIVKTVSGTTENLLCQYSLDDITYTDVTSGDFTYNSSNRIHLREMSATTEVYAEFDNFVLSYEEYPETASRIFAYNTTVPCQLLAEFENVSEDNYINIYYASRRMVDTDGGDTLEDRYDWELLGECSTGTSITADMLKRPFRYIKVEFVNTDTSKTAQLNAIYLVGDEKRMMVWHSGNIPFDNIYESYLRRLHIDAVRSADIEFYYRTDRLPEYKNKVLNSSQRSVTILGIYGKNIEYEIRENSTLPCIINKLVVEYQAGERY